MTIEEKFEKLADMKRYRFGSIGHAIPGEKQRMRMKQPGDVIRLSEYIAKHGSDESVFRSVGVWADRRDVRNSVKPGRVVNFVLDIDRDNLREAYDDTLQLIADLRDGHKINDLQVSLSGGKGFHVEFPTLDWGMFRTAERFRQAAIIFFGRLTHVRFDPATLSPLAMLRLTGSTHQQTGLKKVTFPVDEFLRYDLETLVQFGKSYSPVEPIIVSPYRSKALADHWRGAMLAADTVLRARAQDSAGMTPLGQSLRTALEGVPESGEWSRTMHGRDSAAFTIACYCMESEEQHNNAREFMGLSPDGDIEETMNVWNERNSPPMAPFRISQKIKSAERYLTKKQGA